jgi:DNA-binding CsgD family transcriptional regulator
MFRERKELLGLKDNLTDREREVLTWVARGKTAWEIATILHLSRRTVEWYITQARIKLNAATVTQTIVEAMKKGQISLSLISIGLGLVNQVCAATLLKGWLPIL